MKKLFIVILVIIGIGCLICCPYKNVEETSEAEESLSEEEEYKYHDQAELNELHALGCVEYRDTIEKEYQSLIAALPRYKHELEKEKRVWEKYQEVVRKVAHCENHGSSTSMFYDDVLFQGDNLREESFSNLLLGDNR